MHDSPLQKALREVELSLAQAPVRGESEIVQGAFEGYFDRNGALRLDEDPAPRDRGQLRDSVDELVNYLRRITRSTDVGYVGRMISPLVGVVFPGEKPTTHALVEVRARDGRSLALQHPRIIPIDDGVMMHHMTVTPGGYKREQVDLLSPRAFESERRKLVQLAGEWQRHGALEPLSYLYSAIRGHLAELEKGGVAVTRQLHEFEALGTETAPGFRLRCGDHPEMVVWVRYTPETCRILFQRELC